MAIAGGNGSITDESGHPDEDKSRLVLAPIEGTNQDEQDAPPHENPHVLYRQQRVANFSWIGVYIARSALVARPSLRTVIDFFVSAVVANGEREAECTVELPPSDVNREVEFVLRRGVHVSMPERLVGNDSATLRSLVFEPDARYSLSKRGLASCEGPGRREVELEVMVRKVFISSAPLGFENPKSLTTPFGISCTSGTSWRGENASSRQQVLLRTFVIATGSETSGEHGTIEAALSVADLRLITAAISTLSSDLTKRVAAHEVRTAADDERSEAREFAVDEAVGRRATTDELAAANAEPGFSSADETDSDGTSSVRDDAEVSAATEVKESEVMGDEGPMPALNLTGLLAVMDVVLVSNNLGVELLRANVTFPEPVRAQRDESGDIDVAMSLSVRADYFNQTRRIWEPLLEPFAAEGALTREGTKGTDVSLTTSPLHFLASEPLLLVLSSEALRSDQVTSRTKTVAPYMVRNETGVPIIITLARADGGAGVTHLLGEGDAVPFDVSAYRGDFSAASATLGSVEVQACGQTYKSTGHVPIDAIGIHSIICHPSVGDEAEATSHAIAKFDRRSFLEPRATAAAPDVLLLVAAVESGDLGTRSVTLHSRVIVRNRTCVPIEVKMRPASGASLLRQLLPNEIALVPVTHTNPDVRIEARPLTQGVRTAVWAPVLLQLAHADCRARHSRGPTHRTITVGVGRISTARDARERRWLCAADVHVTPPERLLSYDASALPATASRTDSRSTSHSVPFEQSGQCWYSHESSGSLSTKVPDEHGWFSLRQRRSSSSAGAPLPPVLALNLRPPLILQNLTAAAFAFQISGAAGVLPIGAATPLFDVDLSSKLAFSIRIANYVWSKPIKLREPSALNSRGSSISTVLKSPRAQDKGHRVIPSLQLQISIRRCGSTISIRVWARVWVVNRTEMCLAIRDGTDSKAVAMKQQPLVEQSETEAQKHEAHEDENLITLRCRLPTNHRETVSVDVPSSARLVDVLESVRLIAYAGDHAFRLSSAEFFFAYDEGAPHGETIALSRRSARLAHDTLVSALAQHTLLCYHVLEEVLERQDKHVSAAPSAGGGTVPHDFVVTTGEASMFDPPLSMLGGAAAAASGTLGPYLCVRAIGATSETEWSTSVNVIAQKAQATFISLRGKTSDMAARKRFELGLRVEAGRGKFWRTSIITFTSRFVLSNRLQRTLEVMQASSETPPLRILSGTTQTFHWPRHDCPLALRIRFTPLDAWSGDFDPASLGTTPLKLQMDDDETYIVQARIVEMASGANLLCAFEPEDPAWPPYRLENRTSHKIRFKQMRGAGNLAGAFRASSSSGASVKYEVLPPSKFITYAWDRPLDFVAGGKRMLRLEFEQPGEAWITQDVPLDDLGAMGRVKLRHALPDLEGAQTRGWIERKSTVLDTWSRAYGVLKDQVLYLFTSERCTVLAGVISVQSSDRRSRLCVYQRRRSASAGGVMSRVFKTPTAERTHEQAEERAELHSLARQLHRFTTRHAPTSTASAGSELVLAGSNWVGLTMTSGSRDAHAAELMVSRLLAAGYFQRDEQLTRHHRTRTSMTPISNRNRAFHSPGARTLRGRTPNSADSLMMQATPERRPPPPPPRASPRQSLKGKPRMTPFGTYRLKMLPRDADFSESDPPELKLFACESNHLRFPNHQEMLRWGRGLRDAIDDGDDLACDRQTEQSATSRMGDVATATMEACTATTYVDARVHADGPTRVLKLTEKASEDAAEDKDEEADEDEDPAARWCARIQIDALSLSITDEPPREIAFFCVSRIDVTVARSSSGTRALQLTFDHVQVDNALPRAQFCASLRPRTYDGERGQREIPLPLAVGASKVMSRPANFAPAVHLVMRERAQRRPQATTRGAGCLYADSFVLWLRPTDVRLERELLAAVLRLKQHLARAVSGHALLPSHNEVLWGDDALDEDDEDATDDHTYDLRATLRGDGGSEESALDIGKEGLKLYIREFVIHPVDVSFTYRGQAHEPSAAPAEDAKPSSEDSSAAAPARASDESAKGLLAMLAPLEDARLKLNAVNIDHAWGTRAFFISMLSKHYTRAVIGQLAKVLGAVDVLGNPVGLLAGLGTGLSDLFWDPIEGVQSAASLTGAVTAGVTGVAKGSASLIDGTLTTATKATGTVSQMMAVASFDSAYQRARVRQRRIASESVGDGLWQGTKELGQGLFDGVTGLAAAPYQGLQRGGAVGFVKGLGKGVAGLAVKPAVGAIDFATRATEGMRAGVRAGALATMGVERELSEESVPAESPWARMRQPLTLGARDELTLFDAESALGQQLLLMARVGGTQAELGSRNAAHERSRFHLRVMAGRVSAWAAGGGATRLLLEPSRTSRAAGEQAARWLVFSASGTAADFDEPHPLITARLPTPPTLKWETPLAHVTDVVALPGRGEIHLRLDRETVAGRSQIDRVAHSLGFGATRAGETRASVDSRGDEPESSVPVVYDAAMYHELVVHAILERTIGRARAETHFVRPRASDIRVSGYLERAKSASILAGRKKHWYALAGNVLYQFEEPSSDGVSGAGLSLMLPLADIVVEKTTRKSVSARAKHAILLRHRTPGKWLLVVQPQSDWHEYAKAQHASLSNAARDVPLAEARKESLILVADDEADAMRWYVALSESVVGQYADQAAATAAAGGAAGSAKPAEAALPSLAHYFNATGCVPVDCRGIPEATMELMVGELKAALGRFTS